MKTLSRRSINQCIASAFNSITVYWSILEKNWTEIILKHPSFTPNTQKSDKLDKLDKLALKE